MHVGRPAETAAGNIMSSWARYFVLGRKSRSLPLVNVVDLEGELQPLARIETGFSCFHNTAMACRYDSQWRWQPGSTQAWDQPEQGAPYLLETSLSALHLAWTTLLLLPPAHILQQSAQPCLQVESWLAKAFSKTLQPSAVAININSPGL